MEIIMIKRILALRYVCKKYDLKYHLKLFGDEGWISPEEKIICVSLFQKHFYETLYHEVGHMVAERSLGFKRKYFKARWLSRLQFGDYYDVFVRIEEEAKASKFAMRVLKIKDRTYLKNSWHTYTSTVAQCIRSDELDVYVKTVAKYSKYFENKLEIK